MKQKRQDRHIIEETHTWQCPICPFNRTGKQGRQYVLSHLSQAHKEQIPEKETTPKLNCTYCIFIAKKGSGLSSHIRNKHPHAQNETLKPIKLLPTIATSNTYTNSRPRIPTRQPQVNTTPAITEWTCPRPRCNRQFRSNAGLKSHLRSNTCRFMRDEETSDSTNT